jgi:hypothetical protein
VSKTYSVLKCRKDSRAAVCNEPSYLEQAGLRLGRLYAKQQLGIANSSPWIYVNRGPSMPRQLTLWRGCTLERRRLRRGGSAPAAAVTLTSDDNTADDANA